MSNGRSQAMRDRMLELSVGAFFFLALAILGTFTVILRKDLLWENPSIRYVDFTDVGGMKEGDKVLFRGLQIGKVAGAAVANGGDHIRLSLELNEAPTLYEDYVVEIRNSSVLGGQFVQIEPGSPDKPVVADDAVLQGVAPVDVFKQVSAFFNRLDDQDVFGTLNRSAQNLEKITEDFKQGKGTLHKLIHDDTLYEEARAVVTDARDALKTVKDAGAKVDDALAGAKEAVEGLKKAGASVEAAGTSVKEMSDNVNAAVADAREGKGTLGKIMTDDTLYNDVKTAVADIRSATARLSNEDSTLAKLADDNGQLYARVDGAFKEINQAAKSIDATAVEFKASAENARKITERIESGEGTLGKLVQDQTLYTEAKETLREAKSAISDLREQSPITTFGTFVFGAF